MSLPSSKISIPGTLVISLICLLAICPFFWRGSPSGHDFEFHMFSWMEVLGQWKQGIVYPRWAGLAHWGYGEARFIFYPPASWLLGAGLGAVLPWKVVPGTYCWLVLTLAGISMYRLARKWLPERDALFAAALYAVNPYHLLIVYWRSAFAELLAAVLLPMLMLAVLRLKQSGVRPILGLGILLGAAWLINAPAAVMIHYSVALLATVIALLEHSWRPLWRTALAVLLGAGLAAFYLVPTVYETRWINIDQVLAPGLQPSDNFLFATTADPEHDRFNRLVSTIATVEIAVLVLAVWFSRSWRTRDRNQWLMLSIWGGAVGLIMVSITNPLWQYLPKLRFVQLPWRWLLCLNATLALLITMAVRRWAWRGLLVTVLLGSVIVAGYRIQPPWWDQAADIVEMNDAIADVTGYEGTDEYVPRGADPYEVNKDLPQTSSLYRERNRTKIVQWGPVEKHIVVATDTQELLTLRLFNYPAWEVTVNGKRVETQTTEVTGQMALMLMPGTDDIRIRFDRTRDRTIGVIVSLVSLGILLSLWIKTRRTLSPL